MINTGSKMFAKIKNKKYRDLFVAGQIRRTIPAQVRALRSSRKLKQEELARAAQTTQEVISRIERGGGNLSIKSLLKLASALDVALVVRFEPIDRLVQWVDDLAPDSLAPLPSDELLSNLEARTGAQEHAIEQWANIEDLARSVASSATTFHAVVATPTWNLAGNIFWPPPNFSGGTFFVGAPVRTEAIGHDRSRVTYANGSTIELSDDVSVRYVTTQAEIEEERFGNVVVLSAAKARLDALRDAQTSTSSDSTFHLAQVI